MEDLETVYRAHAQTVYRYLLSFTRDADLAEELTQETFYQAVRSIHRFDGSCKISVWLCQIAKHLWYQQLRKKKREAPLPDPMPETPLPSAEEEALANEHQMALLRSIHALAAPAREVVYLRALGGLSFREIGELLERSEVWARVTFYRAKEKLQGGLNYEP